MQLPQPLTQCDRLVTLRFRRLRQQIGHAEHDNHAIDGLAAAIFAQQVEKVMPLAGVALLLALLGSIAAGGIQQHRFVGEPPVAVARAADAAQRRFAELVRQRELQPGVDQRGGFTGTRGANDHVPLQLVEVLMAEALRPERRALAAGALEVRFFQHVGGFGETARQHLLFIGQAFAVLLRRIAFAGFEARHQFAVEPEVIQARNRLAQPPDQIEQRNTDDAVLLWLQRS